jgi:hypothetical protein
MRNGAWLEKEMKERWRTIAGWSRYEASDRGRIRRKAYLDACNRWKSSVVMKPRWSKNNTFVVSLQQDNVRTCMTVGKLVLLAFKRLPRPDEQARHLDDNQGNNVLSNLKWGTDKQNKSDAIRNGRMWFQKECRA